jgi:hypothetical protein
VNHDLEYHSTGFTELLQLFKTGKGDKFQSSPVTTLIIQPADSTPVNIDEGNQKNYACFKTNHYHFVI